MTINEILIIVTRALASIIPPIPHASGLSNRILKKIYCKYNKGFKKTSIWGGIKIMVDPCDCIGGNLYFIPHLYDRWERRMLRKYIKKDMTFIDIGANVGAYTLWASLFLNRNGRIVSIEADPYTFSRLKYNISINNIIPVIKIINKGVSVRRESLRLIRNVTGNSGGNTFVNSGNQIDNSTIVECDTLYNILITANIKYVDFIKIDIEGYDYMVIKKYLADVGNDSGMKPKYIMIETQEGPCASIQEYNIKIKRLLEHHNYEELYHKNNSLYILTDQ